MLPRRIALYDTTLRDGTQGAGITLSAEDKLRIADRLDARGEAAAEASIRVAVDDQEEHTAAEGNGPVHALDRALRTALERFYPKIRNVRLVDYKVRVLNADAATAAKVRVLIQSTDGTRTWGTVGVSEHVVEASWQALVDSLEYVLLRERSRVSP